MERGAIQSGRMLFREKNMKKRVFERVFPKEDDVVLPGAGVLTGSCVEAFLCARCKKIVIDCAG